MSLAEESAKRKAQERVAAARRADPELEARLDRFIEENPQIAERLRSLSKEELTQRLMAERMEHAEAIETRNRELAPWLKEHPEIVAKVKERYQHVIAESRARASLRAAKTESLSQHQRGPRIGL